MNKRSFTTKQLAIIGILGAIIIIMGYTPLGIIPIPGMAATILHIPVIIGAILLGGKVGGVLGCIMGLTTLTRAFLAPSGPMDLFFKNPLVSVVPRIAIGIIAYLAYRGLKKLIKNQKICVILTSAIGSIANTVLTLGMLVLVYKEQLNALTLQEMGMSVWALLLIIVTTNAIGELLATTVIVPPVVLVIKNKLKGIY